MGFMIFFGISVRNLGIFNPVYLGDFYMGLGAALFMAGVYFFVGFFTFDNLKVKYKMLFPDTYEVINNSYNKN